MPSKNIIKTYVENGFYHIYNRGVEKRNIFQDIQDYKVFLHYLKQYLSKPPKLFESKTFTIKGSTFKGISRQPKNYYQTIKLHCYCLMPNHFHLLVQQLENRVLKNFMQSLATRYALYFNKKYNRVGSLFQGIYKAAHINNDSYLLHLSRYIHLNPAENNLNLIDAYSSYGEYLGVRNTKWIKSDFILKFFEKKTIPEIKKYNSYKKFMDNYQQDSSDILRGLTLEG